MSGRRADKTREADVAHVYDDLEDVEGRSKLFAEAGTPAQLAAVATLRRRVSVLDMTPIELVTGGVATTAAMAAVLTTFVLFLSQRNLETSDKIQQLSLQALKEGDADAAQEAADISTRAFQIATALPMVLFALLVAVIGVLFWIAFRWTHNRLAARAIALAWLDVYNIVLSQEKAQDVSTGTEAVVPSSTSLALPDKWSEWWKTRPKFGSGKAGSEPQ